MHKRILGIDLGVTAHHRAAVLNPASNHFLVKRMRFHTTAGDLEALLKRARIKSPPDTELAALLEATGMSWYLLSHYLQHKGVTVYRVNGRMTRELRRVHSPHAQSDAIDCQVLTRLPGACPEQLHPLVLPMPDLVALKQAVLEYARWRTQAVAVQNRLTAYDHAFWPGVAEAVPAYAREWIRENWFDPWLVLAQGEETLCEAWREAEPTRSAAWITDWLRFTLELSQLYITPLPGMNHLQAMVQFHLRQYAYAVEQQRLLMQEFILPLYHKLYPACPLTSIYGIGEASAALYMAYVQDINRFPKAAAFRQWCGIVPSAHQSGQSESKGRHLTQAGPNLIKAALYVNANVARQWDLGLAKLYHTQMVHYGKHHHLAVCACASHLASRIYTILKQNRPYELRDLQGHPITPQRSKQLIREQFSVPASVRRRSNIRTRANDPADIPDPFDPFNPENSSHDEMT